MNIECKNPLLCLVILICTMVDRRDSDALALGAE